MTDMSEAMKVVGSQAANSRVGVDELSAAIGTVVATTRKSGSEVGTALKSIFINLQNVASSKINKTLKAAGTSMTVMKDGIEQLRTPIEICPAFISSKSNVLIQSVISFIPVNAF